MNSHTERGDYHMADGNQARTRPAGETTKTEERPHQHLIGSALTFDLDAGIAGLRWEEAWQRGDHNAKALVKDDEIRVILIAMKTGARLPEHHGPTRITIQTLTGRLRIVISERAIAWHGPEPHPLELGP